MTVAPPSSSKPSGKSLRLISLEDGPAAHIISILSELNINCLKLRQALMKRMAFLPSLLDAGKGSDVTRRAVAAPGAKANPNIAVSVESSSVRWSADGASELSVLFSSQDAHPSSDTPNSTPAGQDNHSSVFQSSLMQKYGPTESELAKLMGDLVVPLNWMACMIIELAATIIGLIRIITGLAITIVN